MKNLVQIICGCAASETIEECARVPQALGAQIIVVHGIWPRLDHPTEPASIYGDASAWVTPLHQIDHVREIALKHGWHFIQMQEFSYNGVQYNTALEYIRERRIACDFIWFVDSDECIDPQHADLLLHEVQMFRKRGVHSIRFHKRIEILPEWKAFTYDITGGNYGIVTGDALTVRRMPYFDGNFHFEQPINFGITSVPLLHLHHFRQNAAKRIFNGFWHGAGMRVSVQQCEPLYDSAYTRHLRESFARFHVSQDDRSYYLGNELYKRAPEFTSPSPPNA